MDIELMINSFPKLLNATLITLKLLSVSLILGLFIGLGFAILRMNNNKLINKFAYGYSYIFRGTPLLVQIFIIYFGLGQIGPSGSSRGKPTLLLILIDLYRSQRL